MFDVISFSYKRSNQQFADPPTLDEAKPVEIVCMKLLYCYYYILSLKSHFVSFLIELLLLLAFLF